MLLHRLRDYSERLDLTPQMYDWMPVKWLIDLDNNGRFLGFVSTADGTEGKNKRGKRMLAPHIPPKAAGVRARLLAENAEYVLGVPRDPKKKAKVSQRHKVFIEQIRLCADNTKEPALKAVLRFLERLDLAKLRIPGDLTGADNLTFRVAGILPVDLPSVRKYWADNARVDVPEEKMECLVCGEVRVPERRLAFTIKRIPGGQTSGMALISANVPAFESYGLEESLIAPICQECGERFSKAANALIEGEDTHLTIGRLAYIFWCKEETDFSVASLLRRPQPDEVRGLIASARTGKRGAMSLDPSPFYGTAFSASGGRVAVRDWLETTIGEAKENLARWFRLQQIIGEWGASDAPALPIQGYLRAEPRRWVEGLAESLVPEVSDRRDIQQVSPNVPKVLLRGALKGGPLPTWLLGLAVTRNRAEQKITRARAALIKMVLLSQNHDFTQEDPMVDLDSNNRNPAYLCGRLLAVLETIQRAAIPKLGATITDRFFGTASSAPATVFGRLIRGGQPHLGKLRKESPGAYAALQKRLEEVMEHLPIFPKTLTLQEQGLFGLGYYHQRAADRAAAIAHKQASEAGTTTSAD